MSIARPLLSNEEIQSFLEDTLQINALLSDDETYVDFLKKCGCNENKVNFLINKIADATKELDEYYKNNTYVSDIYRLGKYKKDNDREKLRNELITQFITNPRLDDDEDITYKNGGMLPKTPVQSNKKIFFIIGSPASGKSTIANIISDKFGALILDSDYIKRALPEYKGKINGATLVHEESKQLLIKIRNMAIGLGFNIVHPIVGDDYNAFESLANLFAEKEGYDVYIVLTELNRIKATLRALKRFCDTERYVPLNQILDDYAHDSIITFYKMIHFHQEYKYVLLNSDVKWPKRYEKILNLNALDLYDIL